MDLAAKAQRFLELHDSGSFVIPNAWDAASAALMAAGGAQAIATTSSGISWSHGLPDGEGLSREANLAVVARMTRTVDVPVTADLEAGYGSAPSDVADTIAAAIDAGAVGANLEDTPGANGESLRSIELESARLAAAREVADRAGIPFVINARTDVYLFEVGDPADREAMVVERADAFAAAGARSLFVPGLLDLEVVARLSKRCALPLNLLLLPGRSPSIAEYARVGARRISIGGAIASASYALARRAVEELLQGDESSLIGAIPHSEMQQLIAGSQ